jgi:hypothetical protein
LIVRVVGFPLSEGKTFTVHAHALVPVALWDFLRSESDSGTVAGVGWEAKVTLCGAGAVGHCEGVGVGCWCCLG